MKVTILLEVCRAAQYKKWFMLERIVDLPVFQKVEEIVEVVHISHLDFSKDASRAKTKA